MGKERNEYATQRSGLLGAEVGNRHSTSSSREEVPRLPSFVAHRNGAWHGQLPKGVNCLLRCWGRPNGQWLGTWIQMPVLSYLLCRAAVAGQWQAQGTAREHEMDQFHQSSAACGQSPSPRAQRGRREGSRPSHFLRNRGVCCTSHIAWQIRGVRWVWACSGQQQQQKQQQEGSPGYLHR